MQLKIGDLIVDVTQNLKTIYFTDDSLIVDIIPDKVLIILAICINNLSGPEKEGLGLGLGSRLELLPKVP